MDRIFFVIGCVLACLSVAAGAFAAHLLESFMEPDLLAAFETGARYQMVHALGLLAVALASSRWPEARLAVAGWLMVGGTVIFSGSLYLLALTAIRIFGALTPVGGVLLLAAWIVLAVSVWRAAL